MTVDVGGETAFDVVNSKSEKELSTIFRDFGEERKARKIAKAIVKKRVFRPIGTTIELADIIENTAGGKMPQKTKARIFQALRIYVNDEIGELRSGLDGAVNVIKTGARLCVISYHSIEDRTVKHFMKTMADPCVCPPDLPECRCGLLPILKVITRKPIKPSNDEVARNPRSRSSLLRVGEKVTAS